MAAAKHTQQAHARAQARTSARTHERAHAHARPHGTDLLLGDFAAGLDLFLPKGPCHLFIVGGLLHLPLGACPGCALSFLSSPVKVHLAVVDGPVCRAAWWRDAKDFRHERQALACHRPPNAVVVSTGAGTP